MNAVGKTGRVGLKRTGESLHLQSGACLRDLNLKIIFAVCGSFFPPYSLILESDLQVRCHYLLCPIVSPAYFLSNCAIMYFSARTVYF